MLPTWIKKKKLYSILIKYWDVYMIKCTYKRTTGDSLRAFKGKHRGQRCFIIGNGPSLRAEDLDKLKGEVCFASNMIYKIYDKTEWRPTYYCNSDGRILTKMMADQQFWDNGAQISFFQIRCRDLFKPIKLDKILFYNLVEPKNIQKPAKFSKDISKVVYDTYTVTYIMMQIAYYMGFRKIYLLGIDHNYANTVDLSGNYRSKKIKDHFYSGGNADDPIAAQVERMELGYHAAKRFARFRNFQIYNATRGGKLEIFDRVDFNSLFPEEKENENSMFYPNQSQF